MGGGIWTGWMLLSSRVCHVGRRKRRKMSDSRYRAALGCVQKEKAMANQRVRRELWDVRDRVVGIRDNKCQSGFCST